MGSTLHEENRELRRRLTALMTHARHNEQIMHRFQEQELRLIGVASYQELLRGILQIHKQSFDLDGVSLLLVDPEYEIRRMLADLGISHSEFPDLIFVEESGELRALFSRSLEPALGRYRPEDHALLFPTIHQAPASVAVLPLIRQGRLIGSLNLGSLEEGRFIEGTATDFLQHLAAIVAICLENATNNERLKHIGLTDPLTGVHNRRYFDKRLTEEVGRVQRQGEPLSCLFLDIDHFKSINDTHGHQVGDKVLQDVAGRIKAQLRLGDSLARYGGEEFSALLAQTPEPLALEIAERIRQSIANEPFACTDGRCLQVTLSIGVSTIDNQAPIHSLEETAERLVSHADQALYHAKENGRNRVVSSSELDLAEAAC